MRVLEAGRVEQHSNGAAGRRVSDEVRAATEKRQESAKGPGNRGQSSNREAPAFARVCEGPERKKAEKKSLLAHESG